MRIDDARPPTEVFDNRRRGEPLIGCDCVQCFGYCLISYALARRELPELDIAANDESLVEE